MYLIVLALPLTNWMVEGKSFYLFLKLRKEEIKVYDLLSCLPASTLCTLITIIVDKLWLLVLNYLFEIHVLSTAFYMPDTGNSDKSDIFQRFMFCWRKSIKIRAIVYYWGCGRSPFKAGHSGDFGEFCLVTGTSGKGLDERD